MDDRARCRERRPAGRSAIHRRGAPMRTLAAGVARWNAFWFAPGSPITLGVSRLLFFGGLFVWQWPHDFSPWGSYSSVFWMPIWLFDALGVPAFSAHVIA